MRTRGRRARGFTFLEVVIAAGLAAVLLAAVYAAAQMHFQQLEAGRQIADEAQLVRALFRRIRADLSATLTNWSPPKPATTTTTDASGATSTSQSSAPASDFPPGGVAGESDGVTVVIQAPPVDLDFSASLPQGTASSVLRTVTYRIGTADGAVGVDAGVSGLVRDVEPKSPDGLGSGSSSYGVSELLAKEVESLSITYYDGTFDNDYWDSEQGTAPVAITIELGMRTQNSGFDTSADTDGLRYYRMTVALPPAPPAEEASTAAATTGTTTTATPMGAAGS